MKTVTINEKEYSVNDQIEGFSVNQRPSSNVDFYGVHPHKKELFVQFKNGSSFIYSYFTNGDAMDLMNAESIGSHISRNIVRNFPSRKLDGPMVMLTPDQQALNRLDRNSQETPIDYGR